MEERTYIRLEVMNYRVVICKPALLRIIHFILTTLICSCLKARTSIKRFLSFFRFSVYGFFCYLVIWFGLIFNFQFSVFIFQLFDAAKLQLFLELGVF
jgi:hypothetical protein